MPYITVFLFGILAATFALIVELLLPGWHLADLMISGTLDFTVLVALLGVALIEEGFKYIFLRQYALRFLPEKKVLIRDALLLGVSFGIGFSAIEMLLIQSEMSALYGFAPLGTAGIHITTSVLFAVALCSPLRKHFLSSFALAAAVIFHTLYNMIVLTIL